MVININSIAEGGIFRELLWAWNCFHSFVSNFLLWNLASDFWLYNITGNKSQYRLTIVENCVGVLAHPLRSLCSLCSLRSLRTWHTHTSHQPAGQVRICTLTWYHGSLPPSCLLTKIGPKTLKFFIHVSRNSKKQSYTLSAFRLSLTSESTCWSFC